MTKARLTVLTGSIAATSAPPRAAARGGESSARARGPAPKYRSEPPAGGPDAQPVNLIEA